MSMNVKVEKSPTAEPMVPFRKRIMTPLQFLHQTAARPLPYDCESSNLRHRLSFRLSFPRYLGI